jgi:hypothetical protein
MSQFGTIRTQRTRLSSKRGSRQRPAVEVLEQRRLLTTVDWTNSAGGSWDVASNWSNGSVPGPGDDVVIDVSGATPVVTISSTVESVRSITAADPLDVTGGGLSVTANSTISGGLTMTDGTLTASGSGVALDVSGTTTISGASFYAQAGATLSLPKLTAYTEPNEAAVSTLEATGTGSVLSLPALASIAVTGGDSQIDVNASSGGDVETPLVLNQA